MGLAYGVGAQPVMVGVPTVGPQTTATASPPGLADTIVNDGTPMRVVLFTLGAAAGLYALRLAGFRFNVGVSTS